MWAALYLAAAALARLLFFIPFRRRVKEDRSEETLRRLNEEFRAVYQQIMENEHMLRYNDAKNDFDALLQQITGIIGLCADGEDPDTCQYDASSCGGDCGSCAGCH